LPSPEGWQMPEVSYSLDPAVLQVIDVLLVEDDRATC
jgi:hypothetical protein